MVVNPLIKILINIPKKSNRLMEYNNYFHTNKNLKIINYYKYFSYVTNKRIIVKDCLI